MSRRKLKLIQYSPAAILSRDDFSIFVTARRSADGRFYADLLVSRKVDGRRLFPFDGAPAVGPFDSIEEARLAAEEYGARIVAADLACPEM
ncbi:hypothetical protein OKW38_001127 [Paraburkholderia sp. MM5496-R1]|uniref:Uncharacterized protein n=1 Tax=Paraburkholderia tuberum TaxID=157910 RepID=A0A1H1KEJ5_9BURK|nr:DUF6723 family protein [Paraburkholderia tuberum]SDR60467.1 hypothetical protein SAMN05445850_7334 [Paraburkholderia tuberum]